jgi:EmrB/QacA subfamily drug resistance transporter
MATASGSPARIRLKSTPGRWVVVAVVLGSGAAFLETTVVTVAVPSIARDFDLGIAGVQWIFNGFLLSLSALILFAGALGDVLGRRRIFALGLTSFAVTSLLCALAPNYELLVAARVLQGVSGALLIPTSLAIVDTVFVEEDRGQAIGLWAGWSGITSALGPFVGGWLVDNVSWRWVFIAVIPLVLVAVPIVLRHMPDVRERDAGQRRLDVVGAALIGLALAGLVYGLVQGPEAGFDSPATLTGLIGGAVLAVAFVIHERRTADPLLPLDMFSSGQFTGANVTTLFIYFALGGVFMFLTVQLQDVLGWTALAAGAALLPINLLMLVLSPRAGRLSQRVGPRVPMAIGAVIVAGGCALLARIGDGSSYPVDILPAVLVFGLGLSLVVAPLTSAVLFAVREDQAGIGSAINNVAARLAGLLAGAALPLAAGLGGLDDLGGETFSDGFSRAMLICAALCVLGAITAWLTVRQGERIRPHTHPSPVQGCVQCPSDEDEAAAVAEPVGAAAGRPD